jgi:hypothetical protein
VGLLLWSRGDELKEQFPAATDSVRLVERFYSAQPAMQVARPDCGAVFAARQAPQRNARVGKNWTRTTNPMKSMTYDATFEEIGARKLARRGPRQFFLSDEKNPLERGPAGVDLPQIAPLFARFGGLDRQPGRTPRNR